MAHEDEEYLDRIMDSKEFVIAIYRKEVELKWYSVGPCIGGAYSNLRVRIRNTAAGGFGEDEQFNQAMQLLLGEVDQQHRNIVAKLNRPHSAGCPCP